MDKHYDISDFARRIGRSASTVRRWERDGFDLLDHIAKRSACVIEAVNQESLAPREEMTEDLLSIVHTFSCRSYGMRKYKRKND